MRGNEGEQYEKSNKLKKGKANNKDNKLALPQQLENRKR